MKGASVLTINMQNVAKKRPLNTVITKSSKKRNPDECKVENPKDIIDAPPSKKVKYVRDFIAVDSVKKGDKHTEEVATR